jgi:tRNA A-37 threonylcarbamoyl transferase component Bud32
MKKTGSLKKEGGSFKSWKDRFMELNPAGLYYYEKKDKKSLKGEIPLPSMIDVHYVGDHSKRPNTFAIITPERTFYMQGKDEQESRDWVAAIKQFINPSQVTNSNPTVNVTNTSPNPTPTPIVNVTSMSPLPNVAITNSNLVAVKNNNNGARVRSGKYVDPDEEHDEEKVGIKDFFRLKVIGKGAFGKVFLVRKKDNNKVYAMKQLDKKDIKERGEVKHTKTEREVLSKIQYPFLASLHYSFQSEKYLYFVMDFINGGEVFHHLSIEKNFTEERAKFYAAEIIIGLSYLHSNGVIYRDLKPENLLLDHEGHIVITDFGLSKEGLHSSSDTTQTFCGTPEYLAPEIIRGENYNKAVDWWSLGILIFEMINGLPPFYSKREDIMYDKIISEDIIFPDNFSNDAKDIISRFLNRNPLLRLQDPKDIKSHPFFRNIEFDKLKRKEITPPFIPNVQSPDDIGNIDQEFLEESIGSDDDEVIPTRKDTQFFGFTYQGD